MTEIGYGFPMTRYLPLLLLLVSFALQPYAATATAAEEAPCTMMQMGDGAGAMVHCDKPSPDCDGLCCAGVGCSTGLWLGLVLDGSLPAEPLHLPPPQAVSVHLHSIPSPGPERPPKHAV